MSSWNTGHCSWWWDKWAGVDIGLDCYDHDAAYDAGGVLLKLKSDFELATGIIGRQKEANGMINKGLVIAAGAGSYALTSTFGWIFWLKTRYEQWI